MELMEYFISSSRVSLLETKFLNAAYNQDIAGVRHSVTKGVDPNCVDVENGNTALHIAAEADDIRTATKLLAIPNINLEVKNHHGLPPLHLALDSTTYRMLKLLLNNNANVNSVDSFGNTALHNAARKHSLLLAQILFKYNADPNALDMMKNTPLHVAVLETPFLPMVKVLTKHGANINIESGCMSLFLQAVLYCHTNEELQIILYLIKKGADVDSLEKITKRNALHLVALTSFFMLAYELLKSDANPNHEDFIGKTPAELARQHRNFGIAFIFEHHETITRLIKDKLN